MKTKNLILCGLIIVAVMSIVVGLTNNELVATSGDLILNASTNDVVVQTDGNFELKVSGDNDDFLRFSTVNDVPTITPVGGGVIAIAAGNTFSSYIRLYQHATQGNGLTRIEGYNGTSNHWFVGSHSQASEHVRLENYFGAIHVQADEGSLYLNPSGSIYMQTSEDDDDTGVMSATANVFSFTPNTDGDGTLGTDALTWGDVKSVLIQGSDVCLVNGWCFTECSNEGRTDVCIVTEKPTKLMAQKMTLYKFATFEDYQASHMIPDCDENGENCQMIYDETLTEAEFLQYRGEIYVDGKLDFLFGRTNKGSLRDIKSAIDRQEELIQILYDNGAITQEQAIHLRDDF